MNSSNYQPWGGTVRIRISVCHNLRAVALTGSVNDGSYVVGLRCELVELSAVGRDCRTRISVCHNLGAVALTGSVNDGSYVVGLRCCCCWW